VNASLTIKRSLIGVAVGLLVLILATLGFAAAVESGHCRGLLLKWASERVGRPVTVAGTLHVEVFSRRPQISAEQVAIGNPPWMPPGPFAEIGKLSMLINLPGLHGHFGILALSMSSATLHLERDAAGNSNWQMTKPGAAPSQKRLQILRTLSVPGAHVLLTDERRHLRFDGTVSALDESADRPQPLKMEGSGQLNGRAMTFELTGDPLATSSHDSAYHFSFSEYSNGSKLSGRGELPRPFDFTDVDAALEADGADLKDLYYLAGVSLIHTGAYRLTGNFARRGNTFTFGDLAAASGQSDVEGRVTIESSQDGGPSLDVDLKSQLLRMPDLGARAAGRAPPIDEKTRLLLSEAALNPATLRRTDARIQYHARRLEVGRVALTELTAKGTIERGVLSIASLSAGLLDGKLSAHGKLDANSDPPIANAEIHIADAELERYPWKTSGPAPIEGLMQARISITGKGSSLHQIAASANGTVTAVVPQGAVRDSFAEMTGIDLRGARLMLAKNPRETPLRCAAAIFKEEHGTLTAQTLVADTEPVLITGDGEIHLDSESLNLKIRGQPKSLRLLRFNSPLDVGGTLAHPSIAIEAHALKVVDPGHAKDADCPALIAAAGAAGESPPAPRPTK